MADKLNIKMTSKEGLTLHTAGNYFDKDIQVIPDFPTGGSTLVEKEITENGTYEASADGADGFSKVVVNVPMGGGSSVLGLRKFKSTLDLVTLYNLTLAPIDFIEGEYVYNGKNYDLFGIMEAEGVENIKSIGFVNSSTEEYVIVYDVTSGFNLTDEVEILSLNGSDEVVAWFSSNTDPVNSGDCSDEHIIEVEELPTENIDESAIYNLKSEIPFSDLIICDGGAFSLTEMYTQYGFTVECITIPTRTTSGVKALDFSSGLMPLYYIEDEQDVFIYGDLGGTGTNEWIQFGTAFGSSDEPVIYGGSISDISEATTDGYYYGLGGGTTSQYYKSYPTYSKVVEDILLRYNSSTSSILKAPSTCDYVETRPTSGIIESTEELYHYYYVEDTNNISYYMNGEWKTDITSPTVITSESQISAEGIYVLVQTVEVGTHFEPLITPTGTIILTEQGEHDVSKFATAIVDIANTDPKIYRVQTTADLPTNVNEGSLAIVARGSSALSGACIPISWKNPSLGLEYIKSGEYIWTDGTHVYYSDSSSQYVLNKETSTWETKVWNGQFYGRGDYIWTDGTNIYFSNSSTHYVFNKETDTWETKSWTGLTYFSGDYIWTDGTNIYYSNLGTQYVLNKETSTWEEKVWNEIKPVYGNDIWTDGTDTYYSNSSEQYVLNKNTSTWEPKIWNGLTSFSGNYIWTDGVDYYYSPSGQVHYVLNGETWKKKYWDKSFYGNYIWTDGNNYYYSSYSTQYLLAPTGTLHSYVLGSWVFADNLGTAILSTKTITENGTYRSSDEGDNGYSSVTVKVPTTYQATSLDDIPSDAPEGSISIIWEVK